MYILLYTRLLVCLCWLLLVMSLSNFWVCFLSTLPSIKTTFGCVSFSLHSHLSFAFNTNLYQFRIYVWCCVSNWYSLMFYAYKNHKNISIFCDSVVFFLILHIVFASLAGHFYQINWATFCFVFVAKRQVESEMFCCSNILFVCHSTGHGNKYTV